MPAPAFALALVLASCGGPAPAAVDLLAPVPFCGDGIVQPPETCDDGNLDARDGCLASCALSSCDDGVRGGDESAPDCGGSTCPPCAPGLACDGPLDCASGACERGVCAETFCDAAARDGRAYLFCGWRATFAEARAACAAQGYQLLSANDADEHAFVVEVFTTRYPRHSWWLGLTDEVKEGVWVWEDGTPANFTRWWFWEPNDWEGEDCAEFRPDGFWNDNDCGQRIRFICEEPPASPRSPS